MSAKSKITKLGTIWLLAASIAWPQGLEEDHKTSIHGVEIGMDAGQVLDHLGRMPDGRKDEKDEAQLFWKLENGDVLQVSFRKEHVSHLGLHYKNLRPTTDLRLVPLPSLGGSELTARDPRYRADYRPTETQDKMRTVWTRREKSEASYNIEIEFLSSSRAQSGDRFGEFIEFKYVTVPRDDWKKFDQAFAGKKNP